MFWKRIISIITQYIALVIQAPLLPNFPYFRGMQTALDGILQQLQEAELGGFEAQKIYAPPYRSLLTEEEIMSKKPKYAAVNILLYPKDGAWHFPLIHRTHNERDRHSGQISLPGGKKDDADADFLETALRETWEEIGIPVSQIKALRELSPIYIPPSNFFVYAYLTCLNHTPEFSVQDGEVQAVIEIPLALIQNLPNPPLTMALPNTEGFKVPYIDFQNHKIWGATSMILSELSFLLKNV